MVTFEAYQYIISVIFFKNKRRSAMEHFFDAIATLMSNHLRGVIQLAITEFVDMLDRYASGNSYTGNYVRGLPTLKNAIVINLVGFPIAYFVNALNKP